MRFNFNACHADKGERQWLYWIPDIVW